MPQPQDGRLRIATTPGWFEDYRVNSLPTLYGEKLVLRRLDALPTTLSLDSLGLAVAQRHSVEAAIKTHDSPGYQAALKALGDGAERDLRIVEGL